MTKMPDIIKGLQKFCYATMVDLNVGYYYSMALSEETKKIFVISLPWGLYKYNVLPQGVKPTTNIFKQRMGTLFHDIPVINIFMDDTIMFGYSDSLTHLANVTKVLNPLLKAGMQINPKNCNWFSPSVSYLGFLIT